MTKLSAIFVSSLFALAACAPSGAETPAEQDEGSNLETSSRLAQAGAEVNRADA